MVTDVNGGFNVVPGEMSSGWQRTGTATCTGNGVRVRLPGGSTWIFKYKEIHLKWMVVKVDNG